MKAFTGIKDVDLKIIFELNDKDLSSISRTNKYLYKICNDDMFWRNRLFQKYGKRIEYLSTPGVLKVQDKNWKEYNSQTQSEYRSYRDYYIDIALNLYYNPYNFLSIFRLGNKALENSVFPKSIGEEVQINYYLATFGDKVEMQVIGYFSQEPHTLTIENPFGVTLHDIAEKLLQRIDLKDNQLIKFKIFTNNKNSQREIYPSVIDRPL